jgi:hypothetical protein
MNSKSENPASKFPPESLLSQPSVWMREDYEDYPIVDATYNEYHEDLS